MPKQVSRELSQATPRSIRQSSPKFSQSQEAALLPSRAANAMFQQITNKLNLLVLTGVTVLNLSACASNPSSTAPTASAPAASAPAAAPSPTPAAAASPAPATTQNAVAQHGGQVVEAGDYHLELLAIPEGENMHVDFWLLMGADHATIGDAQVTANVQFPDGTQKTVDMSYDQAGQHYKAYIPGFVSGEYRVVIQTDRQGKKVNGRFNFQL
ncbi:MAG: hypothetical protein ACKO7W_11585 [Elainella sp.]